MTSRPKPFSDSKKFVGVVVPDRLLQSVDQLAKMNGVSRSKMIRIALSNLTEGEHA